MAISVAKTKVHTIYKLPDGTRVPGCTTVTGQLNKPALIGWANRLGLEGVDATKYRDQAAEIGTLAHHMIECDLKGKEPDTSDYSKNQIGDAETCFLKYLDWKSQYDIEPLWLEEPMVSEKHRYGGTPDIPCRLNGIPALLDIKTSDGIYKEYLYQVAGYDRLLREVRDFHPEAWGIIRFGKKSREDFEFKRISSIEPYWNVFECLLNLYYAIQEAK